MEFLTIQKPQNTFLEGEIELPRSKSISNRLLIIQKIAKKQGEKINIKHLSDAQDTKILQHSLQNHQKIINIENAGTAFRFLTAYFAISEQEIILTGNDRMLQRPINELVTALKTLNADVEFLENEGLPPLRIAGKKLKGGNIEINANVSSQFISALLLIAPTFENGLSISLKNKVVSDSYIKMTLDLMKKCGIKIQQNENFFHISQQKYLSTNIEVESDWTAASYFFEIAAFSEKSNLFLKNLSLNSCQGDAIIHKIFENLGVKSVSENNGIRISNEKTSLPKTFEYNFVANPDLVQTFAVTLCGLRIPFIFNEIEHLRFKETDRINALKNELEKICFRIFYKDKKLIYDGNFTERKFTSIISTYDDHRMSLSFAPMCLKINEIQIENPQNVEKSFPNFWKELEKLNFILKMYE